MLMTPDLCVIGGGAAGLSVAAGAAQMGASVVLVEAGAMGGDCLNTGCVPSKALLAAAAAAQAVRGAGVFGVQVGSPRIDFSAVMQHVRAAQAAIAPHDSVDRFTALGVTVLPGWGRFVSPRDLVVSRPETPTPSTIRARRFVIATGSRPRLPSVPGLGDVATLTSETIFSLTDLPLHLAVLGGGPQGVELAQAFRRLGAEVTLFASGPLLPREDPALAAVIGQALERDGVVCRSQTVVRRVEPSGAAVRLWWGEAESLTASHLLVASGRTPRTTGLGLAEAEVAFDDTGIAVGRGFRTTNRRIHALGDVVSLDGRPGPRLTHMAGWQAGQVLRAALFHLPAATRTPVPRVIYTDPELAWVGLTAAEARALGHRVREVEVALSANDRAVTEADVGGVCRLVLGRRDRVLGGGVATAHAGEMLGPLTLAVQGKIGLAALAGLVVPYPTRAEVIRRAAGTVYAPRLFSPLVRRLVRLLGRLP